MGGYDFMVVLWIIFIIVGLFRIRDDYRDCLLYTSDAADDQ